MEEAEDDLSQEEIEAIGKKALELMASPEFKKLMQERLDKMKLEDETTEEAEWFGTTGLSDSVERELPRYLRREFGQSLFDEGSMKASDLKYYGSMPESTGTIHYWRINRGKSVKWATIELDIDGSTCLGWGGEGPED